MQTAEASETTHANNNQPSLTIRQDFVGPPKKPRKRPDGTNADTYKSFLGWSYQKWAWAFLRRNQKFIDACDAIKKFDGDINSEKARVATLFGLKRYKSYSEIFSYDRRPLFETSRFLVRSNWLESGEASKVNSIRIRPGEIAIRLDLQAILNNSWGLRGQLKEVEKRVRELVEKIERSPSKPQIDKSPIERVSPEKLVEYLRMLDHRACGATQVACDILVNEAKGNKLMAGELCKADLYSNASDKLAKAEFFANEGYLYLAARSGRPNGL